MVYAWHVLEVNTIHLRGKSDIKYGYGERSGKLKPVKRGVVNNNIDFIEPNRWKQIFVEVVGNSNVIIEEEK